MIDTADFAGLFWTAVAAVITLVIFVAIADGFARMQAEDDVEEMPDVDDEAHYRKSLETASQTGVTWPPPRIVKGGRS